jgi:hypothetical protein
MIVLLTCSRFMPNLGRVKVATTGVSITAMLMRGRRADRSPSFGIPLATGRLKVGPRCTSAIGFAMSHNSTRGFPATTNGKTTVTGIRSGKELAVHRTPLGSSDDSPVQRV